MTVTHKGNEYLCLLDPEDEVRYSSLNWYYHIKCGVMRKGVNGTVYLHRQITEAPPGMVVDHINGNHLDNRRSNLRICTQSENSKNQKKPKNNTSGFKGVTHDSWAVSQNLKKQWIAQIKVNRKRINLGRFLTKEEAAEAYNKAALLYFGEYAKTNPFSQP